MDTRKFIIAATAILFACMPVLVQARHTEDTYYMQYAEGQTVGSLTYADDIYSVSYGIEQSTVDTGNVELFGLSAQDHLIMLAHSDKAFSKLCENSQIGTKINVVLNGNSAWYEVFNAYWISQAEWENEQNLYNFYYTDNTPLTLVTCNHRGGTRGRWVVQCTYSTEPIQDASIVKDVIYLPETDVIVNENIEASEPEVIEATEIIEEIEPLETVEETPVLSITPLNLLKMKKIYVADYIRFYRGL